MTALRAVRCASSAARPLNRLRAWPNGSAPRSTSTVTPAGPSTVTPAVFWAGVSWLPATLRSMREMPD